MAVTQLPSGPNILLVEADFPAASPLTVFDYWTQPTLLQQWWPQEAELEPRAGGVYHLSWPQMNWRLRGVYTAFEPGKRLGFTWRWDHDEPDEPGREVLMVFEPLPPDAPDRPVGTRLLLTHGPYSDTPADQELRIEHHLAGWQHFLLRLQETVAAKD